MTSSLSARPVPPPDGPVRLLHAWTQTRRPAGWADHLACHGPLPLTGRPRSRGNPALIQLVDRAGLIGRGGAGFPTARKLAAVAAGHRVTTVVANGCESDPVSNKDQALLTLAPHLVLDGVAIAAHAVGAQQAMLCIHRGNPLTSALRAAIADRVDDPFAVQVVEVPPRYVASAATALVNFLNTGQARPTTTPPHAAQRGVHGRPTLVDNVETLAHLALIARYGAQWYRSRGTPDSPGTTLITVTGSVQRPGVYEIDYGAPLEHPLRLAGEQQPIQAVLLGGLAGQWLPLPAQRRLPLTEHACRTAGIRMGIAALAALPITSCGLAATAHILRYLAGESAGQCGPCMFGLPAIAQDMTAIAQGAARAADAQRLRRRLGVIPGRGACAHPDGAAGLTASALHVFARDLDAHLAGDPCPAAAAPSPLPLPEPPTTPEVGNDTPTPTFSRAAAHRSH
jgi:NADH:ubiquinone oxidoreductase subunit F (NADH-binding)